MFTYEPGHLDNQVEPNRHGERTLVTSQPYTRPETEMGKGVRRPMCCRDGVGRIRGVMDRECGRIGLTPRIWLTWSFAFGTMISPPYVG